MLIPELTIEIDGGFYPTQDWSMGGFRISGYGGGLAVGDRFAARMFGTIRGRQVEARVFATVVRLDRDSGELAASYYAFEHRAFETLERFATRQLRRRA